MQQEKMRPLTQEEFNEAKDLALKIGQNFKEKTNAIVLVALTQVVTSALLTISEEKARINLKWFTNEVELLLNHLEGK
jgi:hypothetical protein